MFDHLEGAREFSNSLMASSTVVGAVAVVDDLLVVEDLFVLVPSGSALRLENGNLNRMILTNNLLLV